MIPRVYDSKAQNGQQIFGEYSTVLHLECSLHGRSFSIPKFMSISLLRLPRPLAGWSHSQRFCWICKQQVSNVSATWGCVSPQSRMLANQRSVAWRVCRASSWWKSLQTCLTRCCWVRQERLCSVSQPAAWKRSLNCSQPFSPERTISCRSLDSSSLLHQVKRNQKESLFRKTKGKQSKPTNKNQTKPRIRYEDNEKSL